MASIDNTGKKEGVQKLKLTDKELELLQKVMLTARAPPEAPDYKLIGEEMGIKPKSVRTYWGEIKKKIWPQFCNSTAKKTPTSSPLGVKKSTPRRGPKTPRMKISLKKKVKAQAEDEDEEDVEEDLLDLGGEMDDEPF